MIPQFLASNGSVLKVTIDSIAIAPHFTQAEQNIRADAASNLIMAFVPTNPVMTMVACQIAGHHFAAMDTFRELNCRALTENGSIRMRMTTATQSRVIMALIGEMRRSRKDHAVALAAEQATAPATAQTPAQTPAQTQAPPPATPTPTAPQTPRPTAQPAARAPAPPASHPFSHPFSPPASHPTGPLAARAPVPAEIAHLAEYQQAYRDTLAVLEEARALDKPAASSTAAPKAESPTRPMPRTANT